MRPDSETPFDDADEAALLDRFDRYCLGELGEDERMRFETWLGEDAERRSRVEAFREVLVRRDGATLVGAERARVRDEIMKEVCVLGTRHGRVVRDVRAEEMDIRSSRTRWREKTRLGVRTLRQFLLSAGTVVVAALTVVLVSYRMPTSVETTHTYTTPSGQQTTFTLSDGTRVTLAPRTTLQLLRFGSSSRTVALEGQAYFEVSHAAGAPFLVRAGSIATQVLGTAFLVRHYTNEDKVHIAVAEGKVGIVSSASVRWPMSSPLTLTAGHAGDVTDSTVVVNTVDLGPETDWLRGRLVFHNTPVVEVLQTLSRWYGYQFRCNDSALTHESVTLALNARSSAEALSTLEQILSVHLTIAGDTVTLTPRTSQTGAGTPRKQMYDVWVPTREVGQ